MTPMTSSIAAEITRNEVVFIESNVPDIETLINALRPGTEYHILDATRDGLLQMAGILGGRNSLDAIHLISHGASGSLQLGSQRLGAENLTAYNTELSAIGNALKPGGDFLLYGCNVAKGESGTQFMGRLAQTLGADINASTDLTGDAVLGGDWQLEYATGNIETTALNIANYQGVLAAPVFGHQASSTFSRTDIPVSTSPLSRIATADTNGDGKADLIVANQSTLTVLTSNGDGTFAESGQYFTGGRFEDITAADVNNDGKIDIEMVYTTLGEDRGAGVLINNGNGSFSRGIDFPTSLGATELATADLNGDSNIDLITRQSGGISVQIGNGDGTFAAPVDYYVDGAVAPLTTSTMAIADFNLDGKLDIAAIDNMSDSVSVLMNNGDGSLAGKLDYPTTGRPGSIAGADVNGDGLIDLITAFDDGGFVSVKINTGGGTFSPDYRYFGGHPIWGSTSVIAAEFNGDTNTDYVVQNFSDNTISLYKNNGDGSFGKTDFSTGAGPVEIAGADFNGDDRMDIVTSNWLARSVSVLLNQDNSAATIFFKQTPVAVTRTLTLSDPDGDSDWSGGQLKIQITANGDTNDFLTFPPEQPGPIHIWIDAYSNLMAGMTQIGTASGPYAQGGDAWFFTFNSNATNALVQDLVRAVAFRNPSDTPSTLSRTVTFTATDAGGSSASAEQTITVSTANGATLTYSPAIFSESTLDDGSIVTSSLITLTNETFTGNDGDDWSPNVHNVPAGLTPKLIRNDATHATLSFTGQAMAHANADDVNNLTVTFSDWQFSGGSAATVAGATTTNLEIDFDKSLSPPKTLTYSATTFVESPANDGSITTISTISLTDDTFTGNDGDDWSANVGNVPAGLIPKLIRNDATHATLSFTGQAVAHANADDVNNLWVNFSDWQFSGGSTAAIAGAMTTSLAVDFVEPLPRSLAYSATTFVESAINDGSIATSSTISLTNDTFTGNDGDDWSSIVTNVPAGLTAKLIRNDSTHATLSFTGQAVAHSNANDLGDLTINFDSAKFTGGSAAQVSGAATNNLIVDFTDPPVNHAPTIGQPMFANKLAIVQPNMRVISADVNSDGKADLIATAASTVSVLINNGGGSFATKVDYATGGPYSEDVTSADVNGDGKPDLIVENTSNVKKNTLSVLINNGDGSFAAKVDYNTDDGTGFETGGITSADVNNDGMADLVVTHRASDQLSVLINNGDGSFAPKVDYAAGWRSKYVISADVNNDGKPDLIMANDGRFVSVLINNGTGSFVDKVDYETGGESWDATSADVNGDGNVDLIIVQPFNNTVSVLTNDGDGGFANRVSYDTGRFPTSVSSADVNGDGTIDLIVANRYPQTISVLEGKGDGSFAAKVDYAVELYPEDVTSADVDGDGKPDLIVGGGGSYKIAVLLNSPITQFNEQTPVTVSNTFIVSDPDGDAAWTGGHLKIQITANSEANDSLSLPTTNPGGNAIWLDTTGNKLMAGETQIGTADASSVSNGSAWTFTFDNDATNALVQDVARAVRFFNGSDTPGTGNRTVTLTVTDSGLLSASATQIIAVTTDADGDGITNATENSAPGLWRNGVAPIAGDGNGDGLRDSTQNEITSVPFLATPTAVSNPGSAPASYVTLVADAQAGLVDTIDGNSALLTQLKQMDAPADKPANIDMPLGLISFVAEVGTPGITETFSLYVDNSLPVNGYFKKNAAGDWVNIATAVVSESGKTRIDFAITDGGEFDADGLANGIITDPGAIGFQAKSLSFGETTFVEAAPNNGSITTSSVITLINESFTGNVGDDWSSIVSNVPVGLTARLIRNDATHATLSFTGNASAHANANDVNNLTVSFGNDKFVGAFADQVTGATTQNLIIDFADPPANRAPVGASSALLVAGTEDTSYLLDASSLLAGFTDPDGDTLVISDLRADKATILANGDDTWALTPESNYSGPVSLTYAVLDGKGGSADATQSFNVIAVDDPAVLSSADISVQETNAPLVVSGQLSISDVDSMTSFVAQSASAGKYGRFSLDAAGNWSYEANSAFDYLNVGDSLSESFTVLATDGTSTSVSVTITGTVDTTEVRLGYAPTNQSGTGGQWAQAWTQAGYSLVHKADYTNAAEAWSAVKLNGVSSQLLSGGDVFAGDLGVSGQSVASSTVKQEIDGKEVLRVNLQSVADSVTVKLSRLYTNDDGGAFSESGMLRLLDSNGLVVAEKSFVAEASNGLKTVSLGSAAGFSSLELLAGTFDNARAFVYGGYSTSNGGFGSAVSIDNMGVRHGSDFLVDAMDFTVTVIGVPPFA